jgi:hypothetical protein
VSLRFVIVCALALSACRDRQARENVKPTSLELAISRDLTTRFGASATTKCAIVAGNPVKCEATLDGTKLPIEVKGEGKEWVWRVAGVVVETRPVTEWVNSELSALNIPETADCGPKVVVLQDGERVACKLTGGGVAFVAVAKDGEASLELELDAAAAAARGETVTPERDREILTISKALDGLEGESDGEEEVPGDAAVGSNGGSANP